MSTLVFDIETVGEDFDSLDETTQHVLTNWIRREYEGDTASYFAAEKQMRDGLGFSPLTGYIVAIGVLDADKEKNTGAVYFQAPDAKIPESEEDSIKFKAMNEKEMLEQFWIVAQQCTEFVSFNGRGFDVPFLMIRSAVHGIRPSKNLLKGRYLYQHSPDAKHIDLLEQLTFEGAVWRNKGTLHTYCRAFGIKSPKSGGVTGDEVGHLFKSGKYLEIAKYNVGDLQATKELYHKWNDHLRF